MRIPHVSPKNATGLLDKVVGLGKEIFGEVTDSEKWRKAGDAQQNAGTEKLKALRAEAKADERKAKAKGYESAQASAQNAKESKAS